jgi:hypothetical protein
MTKKTLFLLGILLSGVSAFAQNTYYRDADGDAFGNPGLTVSAGSAPAGYVSASGDCNDSNAAIHPGASEVCDGQDNDCDWVVDESGQTLFYRDADGDGYGNIYPTITACFAPDGYVSIPGDCNDSDNTIYPGAVEIPGDGIDQNCDSSTTCFVDADNDGYRTTSTLTSADCDCLDDGEAMPSDPAGDCNDGNATIHPGISEICDGLDNDCDGAVDESASTNYYRDADGDGYGNVSESVFGCPAPAGYVSIPGDCNDSDSTIYPGAAEIPGDEIDQNCEGTETCYADADNDGYRTTSTLISTDCDCADNGEAKASEPTGDCNDDKAAIHPGVYDGCDGADNNCDGVVDEFVTSTYYPDDDGDGYGNENLPVSACFAPAGYVSIPGDCNDSDSTIYPGAAEIPGDEIDQNCDGAETCYADADNDGYRTPSTIASADCDCTDDGEALASEPADDCNDGNAAINPGVSEVCDGLDNDCDGVVDEFVTSTYYPDDDGDGYGNENLTVSACSAPAGYVSISGDCNDSDNTIFPGAEETCDGIDHDCDGTSHQNTENSITENACRSYTAPDGAIYTTTGVKTAVIPNASGCDSLITIDLTINAVDISVTQNSNTLTAIATPASYKWLDCNNNYSPITNESNQSFTTDVSGNYAVEILQNECIDTSICYTVSIMSTIENTFNEGFVVYPNPTNGFVYIDLGANLQEIEIVVNDVSGRILWKSLFKNRQFLDFELDEPAGIYFITVTSENKRANIKLVKK